MGWGHLAQDRAALCASACVQGFRNASRNLRDGLAMMHLSAWEREHDTAFRPLTGMSHSTGSEMATKNQSCLSSYFSTQVLQVLRSTKYFASPSRCVSQSPAPRGLRAAASCVPCVSFAHARRSQNAEPSCVCETALQARAQARVRWADAAFAAFAPSLNPLGAFARCEQPNGLSRPS